MPKVRLIFQSQFGADSKAIDVTDWQEISNDDLKFLKDNLYFIEDDRLEFYEAKLIVLDDIDISDRIKSIREKRAKEENNRVIAEQIAAEKKEERRIAREKKTLEKLQKKYAS